MTQNLSIPGTDFFPPWQKKNGRERAIFLGVVCLFLTKVATLLRAGVIVGRNENAIKIT